MNSDTDIVNRLNQSWLSHADKDVRFVLVHRDEWIRCTDLTREAADEIERLRNERNAFESERDELVRISNKLKHERDEARRSVCEMSIQLGGVYRRIGGKPVEVTTPEGCAEIMRWDCFKENTND